MERSSGASSCSVGAPSPAGGAASRAAYIMIRYVTPSSHSKN